MITEQDNLCYCILTLQYVKRHYVAGYLLLYKYTKNFVKTNQLHFWAFNCKFDLPILARSIVQDILVSLLDDVSPSLPPSPKWKFWMNPFSIHNGLCDIIKLWHSCLWMVIGWILLLFVVVHVYSLVSITSVMVFISNSSVVRPTFLK